MHPRSHAIGVSFYSIAWSTSNSPLALSARSKFHGESIHVPRTQPARNPGQTSIQQSMRVCELSHIWDEIFHSFCSGNAETQSRMHPCNVACSCSGGQLTWSLETREGQYCCNSGNMSCNQQKTSKQSLHRGEDMKATGCIRSKRIEDADASDLRILIGMALLGKNFKGVCLDGPTEAPRFHTFSPFAAQS